jgi:hypothetical protein
MVEVKILQNEGNESGTIIVRRVIVLQYTKVLKISNIQFDIFVVFI